MARSYDEFLKLCLLKRGLFLRMCPSGPTWPLSGDVVKFDGQVGARLNGKVAFLLFMLSLSRCWFPCFSGVKSNLESNCQIGVRPEALADFGRVCRCRRLAGLEIC